MRRKRSMTPCRSLGGLCADASRRLLGDRQCFEFHRNGPICVVHSLADKYDVGDDMTWNVEFRLIDPRRTAIGDILRSGPGHSHYDPVPFADKCQGLPVDRFNVGKQNPITVSAGPRHEGSNDGRGGWRHGDPHHRPLSRKAFTLATVCGRGSRPLRRSNTKRGSPTASLPKRVGAMSLRRRNFSTSLSKCTVASHVL